MAEGVTYADLRFAKSPPEGKGRPPPGQEEHEEASEGELTYENCPAAARPRQPAPASPRAPPRAPGPARRRIWWRVALALLGACLVLLAACLALGLRYWQVSRQLEGASRRHRAESGALAERMGSQEQNLTQHLRHLALAQAELGATRQALRQSWQAGNSTRRQLQQQLEEAQSRLLSLQQEKDRASRELEKARSCQQMGCCPHGWTLFRWKCLWVSMWQKTWEQSKEDCESQEAQLLILKPWDASTIWGAAVLQSRLQSGAFWVGLRWEWNRDWHWVDGARYTGTRGFVPDYGSCAQVSQGILRRADCNSVQRYVCEKAAMPSQ